ncbi:hypothetical protein D3C76_1730340 [compost metagenome]
MAEPIPTEITASSTIAKVGAMDNVIMPIKVKHTPRGNMYGRGLISEYIPTNGCSSDAVIFIAKAMSPI